MNDNSHYFTDPVSEAIRSIHQCSCDWKLACGSEAGVLSLSVFGTAGNRYSIIVIEKEHLSSAYAGREGRWLLIERKEDTLSLMFDLEWVVEAPGSGCLVLCGREIQAPFSNPA